MARLWLVRHGQAGAVDGDYDQLSALGQQQATLLGDYFKQRGLRFDYAQSGTLQRQQQTLDKLLCANVTTLLASPTSALNELPFQDLARCWASQQSPPVRDLQLAANLSQVLRSTLGAWIEQELVEPPLNWLDFQAAALDWLEDLRTHHHSSDELLVVSSGGTIGTLMAALVDAPDLAMLRFNLQLRNTAVCEIELRPRRAHLVSFNSLPHLELVDGGKLITLI